MECVADEGELPICTCVLSVAPQAHANSLGTVHVFFDLFLFTLIISLTVYTYDDMKNVHSEKTKMVSFDPWIRFRTLRRVR